MTGRKSNNLTFKVIREVGLRRSIGERQSLVLQDQRLVILTNSCNRNLFTRMSIEAVIVVIGLPFSSHLSSIHYESQYHTLVSVDKL